MWLVIARSARYWANGPAIATLIAGGLGVLYYFVPAWDSFLIQNPTDFYGLLDFVTFSAVIIR